jgi:hypothetical protein
VGVQVDNINLKGSAHAFQCPGDAGHIAFLLTIKTCRSPYSAARRPASAQLRGQQEHPFIRDAICCNELV